MQSLVPVVLSLVCLSMAVTTCAGHFSFFRTVITPTNVSCTPRSLRACGEHTLLSTNSTPNQQYGPNVCNVARQYSVQTFSYVETMYCYGSRQCRTYCARTNNCTGPMRNFTQTKTECCEGFAVDPDDEEAASRRWHSKNRVLREKGCTTMLTDSLAVCLLDFDSFVLELINDASEVIPLLAQSDSEDRLTVFALNSTVLDDLDEPVSALGHIANGTVNKKHLGYGNDVFRSLRENVFLHVVKGVDTKKFYVNGAEIVEFNVCQARNGVVHTVSSAIPQSTQTIAEILKDEARFSMFLQLLDGANITVFLDVARGKSRTLLAPTNQAFDALPANAVECLLRPENRRYLNQLVLIHIGSPAEYSSTLSQRSRLYTFNTRYYLFVRTDGDGNILVTNDRISLEEMDIPANNGVIHAIPEVIIPPEVEFDKICEEDTGDGEVVAVFGD